MSVEDNGGEVDPEEASSAVADQSPSWLNSNDDLDREQKRLEVAQSQADNRSRRRYSVLFPVVLIGQLLTADTVFLIYGYYNSWRIPSSSIDVWLGASVVEVVGIVLVIVRYLFPPQPK